MLNGIQHMEIKRYGQRMLTISTAYCTTMAVAWVQARVSDTGPGIHRQQWDRVFDLGFTTRPEGSGLGLFIARSLITSMGGQISIENSTIPIGTTFLVELSRASEQSATEVKNMCDKRLRILLVDDEASLREPLQKRLQTGFGYEVDLAANGAEAIAHVETAADRYDVALIDQTLIPEPDGIEVMRHIKERYARYRVHHFTGWGSEHRQTGFGGRRLSLYRKAFRCQ